jgi:hypothetical protein
MAFVMVPAFPDDNARYRLPSFHLLADGQTTAMAVPDANPAGYPDAVSGATPGGVSSPRPDFFGKEVSLTAHRRAGYVAGGLLAAAGAVGVYHFLDLRRAGHAHRDGEESEQDCKDIIHDEWARAQALRWTHVGLVASGESLYLFNAVTGISLMRRGGTLTRAATIHRNAFFVHAGLMVADVITGILLTNALRSGDHDGAVTMGGVHAAIGVTIPLVIIGSGLVADNPGD